MRSGIIKQKSLGEMFCRSVITYFPADNGTVIFNCTHGGCPFCDPSCGGLIYPPSLGDNRSSRPADEALAIPPLNDSDDHDDMHIYDKTSGLRLSPCCRAILNALSYSQQWSSGPRYVFFCRLRRQ